METEKNSPETKSVIPDDVRAAIFGPAVGKLFVRTGTGRTLALTGLLVTTGGRSYWGRTMSPDGVEVYHDVSKLSIEVKSLSKISAEHKAIIGDIVGFTDHFLNQLEKEYYSGEIEPSLALHATDQLREWGYALRYKQYSAEDLVAAGVYKIMDDEK